MRSSATRTLAGLALGVGLIAAVGACSSDEGLPRVAGTHEAVLLREPAPWPDPAVVPNQVLRFRVEVVGGRLEGVLDPSVVEVQFGSGELGCSSGGSPRFEDLEPGTSLTFEQVILGDVFPAVSPPAVRAQSVRVDC